MDDIEKIVIYGFCILYFIVLVAFACVYFHFWWLGKAPKPPVPIKKFNFNIKVKMEKLLNLLNEYEEKRIKKINADWKLRVKLLFKPYTKEALTNQAYQSVHREITSEYYWFIKWLTEKEVINKEKMRYLIDNFFDKSYYGFATYQYLIMILSIYEDPIKLLIYLLK